MVDSITNFLLNFGAKGLFLHSFLDAIFFPIPAFFTQVSLSLVNPSTAIWLATVGYIACILGTPFGFLIGKFLGHSILYKILKKKWVDSAVLLFQKNGETAVLIGAFTPIPFKVFTIMSGVLKFPLWKLIVYAAFGRAVKFYVVGILFYMYGRSAEGMMKTVSLYIFIIAVPLLLIFIYIKRKLEEKRKLQHILLMESNIQPESGAAEEEDEDEETDTDTMATDDTVDSDEEVEDIAQPINKLSNA